jgi:CRISPR system Cascade subunit CasD
LQDDRPVPEHLILRLDGPLQAWGDVALDPRRPTRAFPSRSGLAGLLANALGWQYRDAERTTALQDALRYAVREDRRPQVIRDYQTANLGAIGVQGWTRWGMEKRGGSAAEGTQILEKFYLADGLFHVALTLADDAPTALDEVEQALRRPARPLFLGRKGCPPAAPLIARRVTAPTPLDAARNVPLSAQCRERLERSGGSIRFWYDPTDGEPEHPPARTQSDEVWDRRDFRSNRFGGSRRITQALVSATDLPREAA